MINVSVWLLVLAVSNTPEIQYQSNFADKASCEVVRSALYKKYPDYKEKNSSCVSVNLYLPSSK